MPRINGQFATAAKSGIADTGHSNFVDFEWPVRGALSPVATGHPISGGRIAMRTGGNFEMRMGGNVRANTHNRSLLGC